PHHRSPPPFLHDALPISLVRATGSGAIGNRTIGTTAVGGMLMGTLVGVLVIPGLYYLFAKLAGQKKLIRDEHDTPLSEIVEHPRLEEHTSELQSLAYLVC